MCRRQRRRRSGAHEDITTLVTLFLSTLSRTPEKVVRNKGKKFWQISVISKDGKVKSSTCILTVAMCECECTSGLLSDSPPHLIDLLMALICCSIAETSLSRTGTNAAGEGSCSKSPLALGGGLIFGVNTGVSFTVNGAFDALLAFVLGRISGSALQPPQVKRHALLARLPKLSVVKHLEEARAATHVQDREALPPCIHPGSSLQSMKGACVVAISFSTNCTLPGGEEVLGRVLEETCRGVDVESKYTVLMDLAVAAVTTTSCVVSPTGMVGFTNGWGVGGAVGTGEDGDNVGNAVEAGSEVGQVLHDFGHATLADI